MRQYGTVQRTKYKGINFRSRLESYWARFFDLCGEPWDYEPFNVDLPDGKIYVPDFYLKGMGVFCEVKPDEPTYEEDKKCYAVLDKGYAILTVWGYPTCSALRQGVADGYAYCFFIDNNGGGSIRLPFNFSRDGHGLLALINGHGKDPGVMSYGVDTSYERGHRLYDYHQEPKLYTDPNFIRSVANELKEFRKQLAHIRHIYGA